MSITCQACYKPFTTECILQDHEEFFRSQRSDHSQGDLNPGTQGEYEIINANSPNSPESSNRNIKSTVEESDSIKEDTRIATSQNNNHKCQSKEVVQNIYLLYSLDIHKLRLHASAHNLISAYGKPKLFQELKKHYEECHSEQTGGVHTKQKHLKEVSSKNSHPISKKCLSPILTKNKTSISTLISEEMKTHQKTAEVNPRVVIRYTNSVKCQSPIVVKNKSEFFQLETSQLRSHAESHNILNFTLDVRNELKRRDIMEVIKELWKHYENHHTEELREANSTKTGEHVVENNKTEIDTNKEDVESVECLTCGQNSTTQCLIDSHDIVGIDDKLIENSAQNSEKSNAPVTVKKFFTDPKTNKIKGYELEHWKTVITKVDSVDLKKCYISNAEAVRKNRDDANNRKLDELKEKCKICGESVSGMVTNTISPVFSGIILLKIVHKQFLLLSIYPFYFCFSNGKPYVSDQT